MKLYNLFLVFLGTFLIGMCAGVHFGRLRPELNHATTESTNAPNFQIVRFGPSEVEVRDVNIAPPGYGVATNGNGLFAMVIKSWGVMESITFTNRAKLLAEEWQEFDTVQQVEFDLAAKQFHVSEPPK